MKKLSLFFCSALLCMGLCFGLTACDEPSADGERWGENYTVETAYAQAQELGYSGTLEEFMASIQGKDGAAGAEGKDGVGISSVKIEEGKLIVYLTDGREIDCGYVKDPPPCTHSYPEWTTEEEATCTSIGIRSRVCTKCGQKEIETVESKGHTLVARSDNSTATEHMSACSVCHQVLLEEHSETADENCACGYSEHFTFESNSGYSVLSAYTGTQKVVRIPKMHNGNTVTNIGANAFADCSSLEKVVLPEGLMLIDNAAFQNCTSLQEVVLPSTVSSIFASAFEGCSSLTELTIPNNVRSVEKDAFKGCGAVERDNGVDYVDKWAVGCDTALTQISLRADTVGIADYAFSGSQLTEFTISSSVKHIGDYAFSGSQLKEISVPNTVEYFYYKSFDGCENLTTLSVDAAGAGASIYDVNYPRLTKLIIGNSVTGSISFTNLSVYCPRLTKLIIGNNVTSVSLYSIETLTSLTIGSSVTEIQSHSSSLYKLVEIYNLSSLPIVAGSEEYGGVARYAKDVYTSIDTPSKLSTTQDGYVLYSDSNKNEHLLMGYIGDETNLTLPEKVNGNDYSIYTYAFQGSALTGVVIPDGVVKIGYYAFRDCAQLANVSIGNGVKEIDQQMFYGCTALSTISIGSGVTTIASDAFGYNHNALTSITVASGNTTYHSAGNCLIETASKTLLLGCNNSVIPTDGTVTRIGNRAFAGCSGLTNIILPDTVTIVGYFAFSSCTNLTSVTIPKGVRELQQFVFADCTNLTTINYQGTVEEWNAIYKNSGWDEGTPNYTVVCTDGTVAKY